MGKGRKKTPTKIKEMQGTIEKSRTIENEMVVDQVSELPIVPDWLSEIGKNEFKKVTTQLFNLGMLYSVDLKLVEDYQTANVVESLKQAAALLEPHDIVMVLEPLNWYRNHAGLFLKESPQAFQICKAVNSPSCKILFDIYHQQIQEGNLIPNIEKCWDEIAYFQIGDNPGRKEPTTGEINYKNIFKYIHSRGFKGVLGMEHGNSRPDEAGEMAVIDAYKQVDNFLSE